MVQQESIPLAANVLGTIGTAFGVFRIWTNWRTKSTVGLPGSMMFLWALCGSVLGGYTIVQQWNIPLQVQPNCFLLLAVINLSQTFYYGQKWPLWKVAIGAVLISILLVAIELGIIFGIRPLSGDRYDAAVLAVGILSSILLVAGLAPPYLEIWKRRGRVVGLNFIFLGMDWLGGFFSLMALAAQNSFDIAGGVAYTLCCLIEVGIFISHVVWLVRTRKIRQEARECDISFEEVLKKHEGEEPYVRFVERKSEKEKAKELFTTSEAMQQV